MRSQACGQSIRGFGQVTGMVEANGKLWLGSIAGPAVAWADLAATALP